MSITVIEHADGTFSVGASGVGRRPNGAGQSQINGVARYPGYVGRPALGPQELDAKGYGIELTIGKRRRLLLALLASRRVTPFWARDFGTPALDNLLAQIEQYLANAVTVADIRRPTDDLQGALFNGPQGKDQAYLAGRAVAATGWVAVGDEVLSTEAGVIQQDLINPEDPDLWDPAFFAAGAWAGGIPWSPPSSATGAERSKTATALAQSRANRPDAPWRIGPQPIRTADA